MEWVSIALVYQTRSVINRRAERGEYPMADFRDHTIGIHYVAPGDVINSEMKTGRTPVSRRQFIKGVIASAAAAPAAGLLFGCSPGSDSPGLSGGVERLLTLNVNGQKRPVDVLPSETLVMTLRYKLGPYRHEACL